MASLSLGDDAPPFELPATDGKKYALGEPSMDVRATVVYWTCNHCPYAIAWHDRLIDVASDLRRPGRALPRDQLQRPEEASPRTPSRR